MEMGKEVVVAAPAPSMAPGFRFHPTDEELVRYYLRRKVCGKPYRLEAVTEIDVYKSEPWNLADSSPVKTRDLEWYFFSPVDRKYGNGSRLNRATGQGYWKATGKDRTVRHKNETIGMKKTLVFHGGRAPDGKRTNWVMHEYRLCDSELERAGVLQDAFVLCRIFEKSGLGPPNGDRYAPFVEEEWDEDAALVVPGGDGDDDVATGDAEQVERADFGQVTQPLSIAPPEVEEFTCKRKKSDDFSLAPNKRSNHDDPNSNQSNGSEDSTMSQEPPTMIMTKNNCSTLLEFPLLGSNNNQNVQTFDSSNLEKNIPPGYLKFIGNLENEVLNMTMEKETLKIEVMRAQAIINVLQSRIDYLARENEELKRYVEEKSGGR